MDSQTPAPDKAFDAAAREHAIARRFSIFTSVQTMREAYAAHLRLAAKHAARRAAKAAA